MNGATAEPCVRNTRDPKIKRISITGYNQNFFLLIRKIKNSLIKSIFKIGL
tara:strand:+ start:1901 stop:2053 length:153 start_codon:yes stop_codon:yes gene_type:complete